MTNEPSTPAAPAASPIVVVGSANLDTVTPVPHHPRPGETVIGGDQLRVPGGKGANQAVAAARLGHPTAFVGLLGEDDDGDALASAMAEAGVDTSATQRIADARTGVALVAVDPAGENTIIVSPGANSRLSPEHVTRHAELLASAAVTLLQLEVPLATVEAAAKAGRGTVVLNPAPAAAFSEDLLDAVDVLVPNRTELGAIAGSAVPETVADAEEIVRGLPRPDRVVATLGADGVVLREGGTIRHVPALEADAVDTTAAGDAFCGALAVGLARGESLQAAALYGTRASAIAVTRQGAQPSLPTAAEVEGLSIG